MNLLPNFSNKTPELQELQLMYPSYPIMAENQPQNLGRKNMLSGVKNSISNLYDKIIGVDKTAETPTEINTDGTIETGLAKIERQGFIPDLMSGYQENSTQKFAPENLELDHDNQKSFAFRLGEGLGTAKRVLDSPLGRGLIAGGLILGTGGGALPALTFGGSAAITNQKNRVFDNVYRNALEQMDFDTSSIGGYVDENIYKNILAAKQLQDNYEWRKAQMEMTRQQNEALNAYRDANIAQGWRNLELRENENKKKVGNSANLQAVSDQLDRFADTFKSMPNKIESNTLGRIRSATGFETATEANFNSQRTLLFNKIARDLGGEKGVLSDQDIARIEKSLPNYTDSYAQKQAKMQAIYDLLEDRLRAEGLSLSNVGNIAVNNVKPKTNDLPNVDMSAIEAELKRRGAL